MTHAPADSFGRERSPRVKGVRCWQAALAEGDGLDLHGYGGSRRGARGLRGPIRRGHG
eukprot:CAMPEP_0175484362 /NCGR_PEP_ID=MMETSP0095-20121207/79958_1 /TAXON_ID=311494 /ORGANISM="Alexandrium monilatum, Strain CCMP3105" /LENGTH=57 /DNA_ID=CAMNT_0016786087 /DNA_START=154 /DNA_END=324 /DNA_ORIENTATION=-